MATKALTRLAAGMATLLLIMPAATTPAQAQDGVKVGAARVTINGTSNIHAWTAATTEVKVVRVKAAAAEGDGWDALLAPGGLEAFEIAIPTVSLSAPKKDLDKNMHKAMKAEQHPDVVFRLSRIENGADAAHPRALGVLRIAGVEKEIVLPLVVVREGDALKVSGELPLLMTDYGVVPPKAMMGMLRTDPKVSVKFDVSLTH